MTWGGTGRGTWRETTKGTLEGTSNRIWMGTCCCVKLRSVKVHLRSGPGLVQFRAQV